jgi:glycerophosphoryl diester phosphodiesterase
LVVIHDDTLERTTSGIGRVADKSLSYLRGLDAGKGERIPLLEEVFDTVSRRAIINVELKGPDTAAAVVRLIEVYVQAKGWQFEDFLVSSFDLAQLQTVKKLLPRIRTGTLVEKVPSNQAAFAEQLGAWSLHPGKHCVTHKLVADAHRRGLKVFVFTVNKPAEIAAMTALGVDGVFTDYPDRVMAFLHTQNNINP